ncbi:hypothetical protein PV04_09411 [Phialophora macrospora]|uniref:Uncharacterized protein n=1 Tax=Phialophora macrospora TaxID=1851006 RepID=A0A0D2DQK5_9EURO|nr:hypothetical protein PV04_09411 [Phialophora macrospora]
MDDWHDSHHPSHEDHHQHHQEHNDDYGGADDNQCEDDQGDGSNDFGGNGESGDDDDLEDGSRDDAAAFPHPLVLLYLAHELGSKNHGHGDRDDMDMGDPTDA